MCYCFKFKNIYLESRYPLVFIFCYINDNIYFKNKTKSNN